MASLSYSHQSSFFPLNNKRIRRNTSKMENWTCQIRVQILKSDKMNRRVVKKSKNNQKFRSAVSGTCGGENNAQASSNDSIFIYGTLVTGKVISNEIVDYIVFDIFFQVVRSHDCPGFPLSWPVSLPVTELLEALMQSLCDCSIVVS